MIDPSHRRKERETGTIDGAALLLSLLNTDASAVSSNQQQVVICIKYKCNRIRYVHVVKMS